MNCVIMSPEVPALNEFSVTTFTFESFLSSVDTLDVTDHVSFCVVPSTTIMAVVVAGVWRGRVV